MLSSEEYIKEKESLSLGELIEYVGNTIKSRGDVFLIKIDGDRKENIYTSLIVSTQNSFETIRASKDTLQEAIITVFDKYLLR